MGVAIKALGGASVLAVAVACSGGVDPGVDAAGDAGRGQGLFENNCAVCHGPMGQGTRTGPPLVHEFYVPSHHADAAFQLAVRNGVQPHHWAFGPMPPVPSLEVAEVADIVAYVRLLQRDAGLIE